MHILVWQSVGFELLHVSLAYHAENNTTNSSSPTTERIIYQQNYLQSHHIMHLSSLNNQSVKNTFCRFLNNRKKIQSGTKKKNVADIMLTTRPWDKLKNRKKKECQHKGSPTLVKFMKI